MKPGTLYHGMASVAYVQHPSVNAFAGFMHSLTHSLTHSLARSLTHSECVCVCMRVRCYCC